MSDKMKVFWWGVLFGIVLANVGVGGVIKILDKGVSIVENFSRDAAK